MKRSLLIVNSLSGSAASVDLAVLRDALKGAALAVEQVISLPDDDCPDRAMVEQGGFDVVVIFAGDGTVASMCDRLRDWPGAVLVLPGGTMNLLSRRLHGDATAPELLEKLGQCSFHAQRVPVICFGQREIMTGLTVGPSAHWGEVREGIRHGDVATLAQTVPSAWSETLADEGVWVKGFARQPYAAVFIEPHNADSLSVVAFRANNIGDMLGHGVAWLRHDFRDGPKDEIGVMHKVTVIGDDRQTGLLIDGEYEDGELPLTCHAGMSSVRFLQVTS